VFFLPDVDAKVADGRETERLVCLLRFLYTNALTDDSDRLLDVDGDGDTLVSILLLANKFGISSAAIACASLLTENLTYERACAYIEMGDSRVLDYACQSVVDRSIDFIVARFNVRAPTRMHAIA
jgi:hypothetical protein